MPKIPFRTRWLLMPFLALVSGARLPAGEVYFTGFENFPVGDDTIAGSDSWIGSHAGLKLHAVMNEALHGVLGIGNAAVLGGYATTVATSTSKTVYIRRPVNLDPVALGQEIATFSVVFGIKDSTILSLIPGSNPARYKRDNFEFLIYNKDATPALLGGVQFDNTTLDSTTGKPRRLIYRLARNASTGQFEYISTGYNFLADTLETLELRVNFRTNRWTASLSDIPVFQDLPFYSGTAAKNLGSVMAKMAVTNSATTTNYILPGDNYLLMDDYSLRTDAPAASPSVAKSGTAAAKVTWDEEAGYTYQVLYSTDCVTWNTSLPGSVHAATVSGATTYTDPTSPVPAKRFYRMKSTSP